MASSCWLRSGAAVAMLAALAVGGALAWKRKHAPPAEILKSANIVKNKWCTLENYQTEAFFRKSGFVLLKDFVPERDSANLKAAIANISYETRYVCGASDIQPKECMNTGEELTERFPEMMGKIKAIFEEWRDRGLVDAMRLEQWGALNTKGSEYIAITAWPFPWSLFKGDWEYYMGPSLSASLPRVVSLVKGYFTILTGIPLYTGYHGWHQDGPDQEGGRYHKLFVMVDKANPDENRRHSNLVLLPLNFQSPAVKLLNKYKYYFRYFGQNEIFETFSCTVEMDPGDALFFRENVFHRTQNMLASRYSLILDIQ